MLLEQRGKAFYSEIGKEMKNKFSDFVPKNYGSKNMGDLIRDNLTKIGNYEIKTDADGTTRYLAKK
jgi:hypothetical protein